MFCNASLNEIEVSTPCDDFSCNLDRNDPDDPRGNDAWDVRLRKGI